MLENQILLQSVSTLKLSSFKFAVTVKSLYCWTFLLNKVSYRKHFLCSKCIFKREVKFSSKCQFNETSYMKLSRWLTKRVDNASPKIWCKSNIPIAEIFAHFFFPPFLIREWSNEERVDRLNWGNFIPSWILHKQQTVLQSRELFSIHLYHSPTEKEIEIFTFSTM